MNKRIEMRSHFCVLIRIVTQDEVLWNHVPHRDEPPHQCHGCTILTQRRDRIVFRVQNLPLVTDYGREPFASQRTKFLSGLEIRYIVAGAEIDDRSGGNRQHRLIHRFVGENPDVFLELEGLLFGKSNQRTVAVVDVKFPPKERKYFPSNEIGRASCRERV